jgi:hypothetical protein
MSNRIMFQVAALTMVLGIPSYHGTGEMRPMRRLDPDHRASERRKKKRKDQKAARRRNRK